MSARPSAHGYIPRRLCEIYSARDINPIAARQKSPSQRNPSRHANARQHFSGEMDRPVPTILLPGKPPPSRNSTMPPHGKCQSGLSALCFSSATQTFAEPGSGRAQRRGAEMDFVRTVFIQCAQTSTAPGSGHAPPARYKSGFCSHCFYPMRETSAAPDSSHAPPARCESGFCSHCFYPMRANLRRPRFQSRPTGEVRRGAIGLP